MKKKYVIGLIVITILAIAVNDFFTVKDGDWGATVGDCDEICSVYYAVQDEITKDYNIYDRNFPDKQKRRKHIKQTPDGFRIESWFYQTSEFQDTVFMNFSCLVRYDQHAKQYQISNLEIIPRKRDTIRAIANKLSKLMNLLDSAIADQSEVEQEYFTVFPSSFDVFNGVFGYEEPETFLHPSAQEQLFDRFIGLCQSGYQLLITTHSPIVVSRTHRDDLIHIVKTAEDYIVKKAKLDLRKIATDLGVKLDNSLVNLFKNANAILFVEGYDDAVALNHCSQVYKDEGVREHSFNDLGIVLIPTGGCGSIKHWVTLDLISSFGLPFVIYQDSDIKTKGNESVNKTFLEQQGFNLNNDFLITKKRELENYIPSEYLNSIVEGARIEYGDFDDVKEICGKHANSEKLGGENVLREHFTKLSYKMLRSSFYQDEEDEFVQLYDLIVGKIKK